MEQKYNVSSNPRVRDGMTTSRIMQLVVIALLPCNTVRNLEFWFSCIPCCCGNSGIQRYF